MSANMIRLFELCARGRAAVSRFAPVGAAWLWAAAMASPSVAAPAPRILYQDEGAKPAGPVLEHLRTPFDCAGRDTLILTAALSETVISDDTTGGPTALQGYGCRSWIEQGPEHVYRLEVTEDLQLWAGLSGLGTQDLDLFLLDGCDTDQCLAGANTELQVLLPAGTYWLVVDGYGTSNPAAGPYTLTLQTRWPGVPPQICLPGGAIEVACEGTLISQDGDLTDAPNLLQGYDCSPSLIYGGEAWYAITLPGTHEVKVNAVPASFANTLDLALWVFDGCGAGAACLDYADEKAGGEVETVTLANDQPDPVTIYLAVDCRRAPTALQSGAFSVDFICQSNVATEQKSLGSVRSMFR